MELDAVEARVVGSLAEKQLTTPDQYPLTLNALVAACNQSSNRDPVVAYSPATVEAALASLKSRGLVRWVHPSHGRSVTRFRQVLEEVSGIDARQLALVALLLLRGPQTAGELRGRAERMARFDSVSDLERELDALAHRDDPFVARLSQRPGQREARYAHLLGGDPGTVVAMTRDDRPVAERAGPPPAPAPASAPSDTSILERRVAALEAELDRLRRDVDSLRRQ